MILILLTKTVSPVFSMLIMVLALLIASERWASPCTLEKVSDIWAISKLSMTTSSVNRKIRYVTTPSQLILENHIHIDGTYMYLLGYNLCGPLIYQNIIAGHLHGAPEVYCYYIISHIGYSWDLPKAAWSKVGEKVLTLNGNSYSS